MRGVALGVDEVALRQAGQPAQPFADGAQQPVLGDVGGELVMRDLGGEEPAVVPADLVGLTDAARTTREASSVVR